MLSKNEIKYIQSLRLKKSRLEYGQFIAEGPKIIYDIINESPEDIVGLYATETWCKENGQYNERLQIKCIEEFQLEKISALQTPQQVLAIVALRPIGFIPFADGKWQLMLDGLQDPGNMGSILRIADWFGISTLYCSLDTVDVYNPKVVQAAMGSLWRVNVCYGHCGEWLKETSLPVYGTLLEGENIYTANDLAPGIILIGNEGRGIRPEMMQYITKAITIPRVGKAESLNAAVAAGIVVGQLVRAT